MTGDGAFVDTRQLPGGLLLNAGKGQTGTAENPITYSFIRPIVVHP